MAINNMVGDATAKKSTTIEAQIHLEMDIAFYNLITRLMHKLEASSINEVIRRAIRAHEAVDKIFGEELLSISDVTDASYEGDIKTLHVRIPQLAKECLDREKLRTKSSYSEVIARSVIILDQLVNDQSDRLEQENKSHANDEKDHSSDGNPSRPIHKKSDRRSGRRQLVVA